MAEVENTVEESIMEEETAEVEEVKEETAMETEEEQNEIVVTVEEDGETQQIKEEEEEEEATAEGGEEQAEEEQEAVTEEPPKEEGDEEETADTSNLPTQYFVGNVPFTTTEAEFKEFFENLGELETCKLMADHKRKKNSHRGFGFVRFKTEEDTAKFLATAPHTLGDRELAIKVSKPKSTKLFLAPIDRSKTNKESITSHFEQWGTVTDVYHNVGRGYAFITLQAHQAEVNKILATQHQTINGVKMECKIAKPRQPGDPRKGGPRGGGRRGGFGYGYDEFGPPQFAPWGGYGPNMWMSRAYNPYNAGMYSGWGGY